MERFDATPPAKEGHGSAEAGLAKLVSDAPIGMALLDRNLRFVAINRALAQMNGASPQAHLGHTVRAMAPDLADETEAVLDDVLHTARPIIDTELSGESPARSGRRRRWRVSAYPVRGCGNDAAAVGAVVRELTEPQAGEADQLGGDERFRALVEAAPIGIIGVDREGRMVLVNPHAEAMFGYRRDELHGETLELLVPDALCAQHIDQRRAYSRHPVVRPMGGGRDLCARRKDGSEFEAEICLAPSSSSTSGPAVIATVADISERKKLERQLERQALHDPLTQLPNRTLFMERVATALHRARRHDSALALLFLDLDRFKVVNDSLGHDAGDRLLLALAGRLQEVIRPEDSVARVGGDEFAVLCEDVSSKAAVARIAERITEAVGRPFMIDGERLVVGVSIGIVWGTRPDETSQALVRDADATMYRVKARGGGFEFFNPNLRTLAMERLQIEQALRLALEQDGFFVVYQPLVRLASGRVNGVEALVRWDHAKYGELGPAQFIPVAEEIGVIVPLGYLVLERACHEGQRWRRAHPDQDLTIAVNLSLGQLADPGLAETLRRVLAESGLPASALCLEITESALMADAESSAATLQALCELGIRFAVDDFGTGYSSLAYLERFPVSQLKIDASFVRRLRDPTGYTGLVDAVARIGQALGLEVVAEGVETAEQLEILRGLGCDLAQGSHFARPQDADEIAQLLAAGPTWK